jgi:hypothetical protein
MPSNRMPRMIRRIAFVAGLLFGAGCVSGDGCGPIERVTKASGEIRDGDALIATATVMLTERRADASSLRATVTGARGSSGAPLRGHVLRVRVVNAGTGRTIRVFRVLPPSPGSDEVIEVSAESPGDKDAVKRMLRRRRGVLQLETNLPGRERITVPLTRAHAGGWVRTECG